MLQWRRKKEEEKKERRKRKTKNLLFGKLNNSTVQQIVRQFWRPACWIVGEVWSEPFAPAA